MKTRTWKISAVVAVLIASALSFAGAPAGARAADQAAGPTSAIFPAATAGATADDAIAPAAEPVAGEYVVELTSGAASASGVEATAKDLAEQYNGTLGFTYDATIEGFSVRMARADAERLAADPRVTHMSESGRYHLTSAPWHLDRIDQTDLPLNGSYVTDATGAGVDIYIVDSGINTGLAEFGGRASVGLDTPGDGYNGQDCAGHGTMVASDAAGANHGVAVGANLISVRIFTCAGTTSDAQIIEAVDWITSAHSGPSVVNMSFEGGGGTTETRNAFIASMDAGITYVASAGNGDFFGNPQDTCNHFPALIPGVIAVAATAVNDTVAPWSNYGTCIDLLAPGVAVPVRTKDDTEAAVDGTSFSAPIVAGAAALFLQSAPDAPGAQVQAALLGAATPNRITGLLPGTPNLLVNTQSLGLGASLTVLERNGTSQDFAFTCTGGPSCHDFTLDDDADATLPSAAVFTHLAPGTYTVTQAAAANWSLADLACSSGVSVNLAARQITFTVTALEHASCTFSNSSATITVVQSTYFHVFGEDFPYDLCRGSDCVHFTLDDDAPWDDTLSNTHSEGGLFGDYTLTQVTPAGFNLLDLTCSSPAVADLAGHKATVSFTGSEHVTCTFSNRLVPPANDLLANATVLTGDPTTGTLKGSEYEPGEPFGSGNTYGGSVWYRWTALTTGPASISTCGSNNFNAYVDVYTGSSIATLSEVPRRSEPNCGGPGTRWPIDAVAGTTYLIQVADSWNVDRTIVISTPPGAVPTPPVIQPGVGTVVEGDSGQVSLTIPVTLSKAWDQPVTVNYAGFDNSASGIATLGTDYLDAPGTLTFAPGETSKSVTFQVLGDRIDEPPAYFGEWAVVSFTDPTNATIDPAHFGVGIGIIIDDDPTPTITPGSGWVVEGNSGQTIVNVPVTLSNPAAVPVTVNFATLDRRATDYARQGVDYAATSGTVTFAPGETAKTVAITVNGDTVKEPATLFGEWIAVLFSAPVNARFATTSPPLGYGIIVDDD